MLFLALRHLLSRKKQSTLILIGISLGTAIFIFLSGIQLGFRSYILRQLIENNGHIVIKSRDESIRPAEIEKAFFESAVLENFWLSLPSGKRSLAKINNPGFWHFYLSDSADVLSYVDIFTTEALAQRGSLQSSLRVVGVNPESYFKTTLIAENITQGKWMDLMTGGPLVVVGQGFLDKFGLRLGDTFQIKSLKSETQSVRIVAVYESGMKAMDDTQIFTHIKMATQLAKQNGQINQIIIKLKDVDQAAEVAKRWSHLTPDQVQSWDQENAQFLELSVVQDLTRNFITVGIILVASFGIYNVLSIIVNQKRKEIAILRSLGFLAYQILQLFMIQGLILGVLGALIGVVFGWGISEIVMNLMTGLGRFKFVIVVPSFVYLQGLVLAIGSSVLAGWLPAYVASRLQPLDIIREE